MSLAWVDFEELERWSIDELYMPSNYEEVSRIMLVVSAYNLSQKYYSLPKE